MCISGEKHLLRSIILQRFFIEQPLPNYLDKYHHRSTPFFFSICNCKAPSLCNQSQHFSPRHPSPALPSCQVQPTQPTPSCKHAPAYSAFIGVLAGVVSISYETSLGLYAYRRLHGYPCEVRDLDSLILRTYTKLQRFATKRRGAHRSGV